jgi:hypothetical protein
MKSSAIYIEEFFLPLMIVREEKSIILSTRSPLHLLPTIGIFRKKNLILHSSMVN